MFEKKVSVLEKKNRLRYKYQNWLLVSVSNTETWFRSHITRKKEPSHILSSLLLCHNGVESFLFVLTTTLWLIIFFLWYVVLVPVMVLAKSIGECIRILLQKILYPIECVLFCSTTLVLLSHRGTLDPNSFHISNISMNLVN